MAYGLFIIYIFISNVIDKDFSFNWDHKMKLWPDNFADVASVTGNFSLAFFIHNGVTNILANAQHPKSNPTNLFFGYLNVAVIYGFVGIFGKL